MRLILSAANVIPPVYSNVQADARAAFNKAATGSVLQKGYEQIGRSLPKSNKPTLKAAGGKLCRNVFLSFNIKVEGRAIKEGGFASNVMRRTWIQVSTTCGSGWVDVEHAIFLLILNADG